jgi:hypothetical protein
MLRACFGALVSLTAIAGTLQRLRNFEGALCLGREDQQAALWSTWTRAGIALGSSILGRQTGAKIFPVF